MNGNTLKKYGIYNCILLLFFLADGIFKILLPIYFISLGHSFTEIGIMVASLSLGLIVIRLFTSIYSDRAGRKIDVIISLMGSGIVCFGLPFCNTIPCFMIALIMRGACRGAFLEVKKSFIKDICAENEREKMLGLTSTFSTVGLVLGGIISGWLYIENNIKILFFAIGTIYILAAFISLCLLPYKVGLKEVRHYEKKEINFFEIFVRKVNTVPYSIKCLCGVNMIQNIVTPPLWSIILPVYFTSVMGMSVRTMGFVFAINNILSVPSSAIGGMMTNKRDNINTSVILNFSCAFLAMMISMQKESNMFIILILLLMMFFRMNSPVLEKIESISARDNETGLDLGLISISATLGSAIGAIFFGIIIDAFGFMAAYEIIGLGYVFMNYFLLNIRKKIIVICN